MVFIQFFQDLFHYGLTEKNGFGIDLETAAIFRYCSHFFIIQVDDLPVFSDHGGFLPAQEIRRHLTAVLFLSQIRQIFPKIANPDAIRPIFFEKSIHKSKNLRMFAAIMEFGTDISFITTTGIRVRRGSSAASVLVRI